MPSRNKIKIFREPTGGQSSRPSASMTTTKSECKEMVFHHNSLTDKENLPIKTYKPKCHAILHPGHGLSSGKVPDSPQTPITDNGRSRVSVSSIPVGCHGRGYINGVVLRDKTEKPRDRGISNAQDNNSKYSIVPRESSTYNQITGEGKCHSKDDCENSKFNSDPGRNIEKPFGRKNGKLNEESVYWTGRNGSAPSKPDVDNNAETLIKPDRNSVRMEEAGQVIAGFNDRVELQTNAGFERDRVEQNIVGSEKSIHVIPKSKASLVADIQKQTKRKSNFIILRKMSENTRKINMRSIGRDENANFGAPSCNDASDITKTGIVDEFKSREENNCFDGAITSQKIISGRIHDGGEIDKNRGLIKVSDPRGGRQSPNFVKTQTDAPSMSVKRSISSDSHNSRREESRRESFHAEKISISKSMRAKKLQPEVIKDKCVDNDSEVPKSRCDINMISSINMDHGEKLAEYGRKRTDCSDVRNNSGIKRSRLPVIGRSSQTSVSPRGKSDLIQNKREIVQNEDRILPPNKGGVVKTEIINSDNKKLDLPVVRYNSNLTNCESVRLTSGDIKDNDSVIINTPGDAVVISPVQRIDREVARLQSTYIRVKQQRNSSTNTNSNVSTEQVTSPGECLKSCTGSSLNSTDNARTQSIYVTDVGTRGHGLLKQGIESGERSQKGSEAKDKTGYTKRISRLRDARSALKSDLRVGSYVYWGFGSNYTTKRSNCEIHDPRDVQDSQECTVLISNQLNTDCYGQMDCTETTDYSVRTSDIPICNDRKTLHSSKSKHINKPDLNKTLSCLSKSRNVGDRNLPIVSGHDTVGLPSEPFCNSHGRAQSGSIATRQLAGKGDCPRTRQGATTEGKSANDITRSDGHKTITQNKANNRCPTQGKYCQYDSTTGIRAEQGNDSNCTSGERVMNELGSEIEGLDVNAQKTVISDVHVWELNDKLNKTVNADKNLEEGVVNSSQLANCKNLNTSDFKDFRPSVESVTTCRIDNFIDSDPSPQKLCFEKDSKEINSAHSESKNPERHVEGWLHCNVANKDNDKPPTRVIEAEPRRLISPNICQVGSPVYCLCSSSYSSCDPTGVRYDNGNPTSHDLIEAKYTCAKISNNNKTLKSANSVTFTDEDECGNSFRLICLSSDTGKSKLYDKATGGKVNDWSANRSNRELIYDAGSDDYECRLNVPTCTAQEEENIDVAAEDSKCQLTLLGDGGDNYSKQNSFSGVEILKSNNNNETSGANVREEGNLTHEGDGVNRGQKYGSGFVNNENYSDNNTSQLKVKSLISKKNEKFEEDAVISNGTMVDILSKDESILLHSEQKGVVASADDQLLINAHWCDKSNVVHSGNYSSSSENSNKNHNDVDNEPNDAPVGVVSRHNTGSTYRDSICEENSDSESGYGQNPHSSSDLLLQVRDINGKRDISTGKTEVNIDRISDTKEHGGETADNGKVNVDKFVILSTSANKNIQSKQHEKDKNSNVSKSAIGITKTKSLKAKTSTSVFSNMKKSNVSTVSTQNPKSKKQIADGPLSREQTKQKSNKPASETSKVSDKNVSTDSNKNENFSTSKTSIPASSKYGIPGQSSVKTKPQEAKIQKMEMKFKSKQSVSVDNENLSRNVSGGTKLGYSINSHEVKRQNSNSNMRNSSNSKESSPVVVDRLGGKTDATKSLHRQVSVPKSNKTSTDHSAQIKSHQTSYSSTRSNSKESSPDIASRPEVQTIATKLRRNSNCSVLKSNITSPKISTRILKRQTSNSSSRSSSRQSSKESSPEVVSVIQATSSVKPVASLKDTDKKITIANTPSTKVTKLDTNTRIANTLSRGSMQKNKSNIPGPGVDTKTQASSAAVKNRMTKTLPVSVDNKTTKCISKITDSKQTNSKSSQSSPALSRSSRSSTPSDRRTKDSVNDKSPKLKRSGLKLPENRKLPICGPSTRTRTAPTTLSLGKLPMRQISNSSDNSESQRAITPSSRSSSVLSCKSESDSQATKSLLQNVSKHVKLAGPMKSRTENVSPALSRKSRSNTPIDNIVKKVPVQSKSTLSQKSYDKSPVAQRKSKYSKATSLEIEKVTISKDKETNRHKTKAVNSKLPMANSSKASLKQNVQQPENKGCKPGAITPIPGKSMANALSTTRKAALKDKTSSGEKKNFKSDITKNQDSVTKKIKIPTGDYLTNQKSVQLDTRKKLPNKFDLSTDISSTSISNKNKAKMQQMNTSAVENHTKEGKNSIVAHESRCVMSDCSRENETKSNSKTTTEIRNQNLSSGDLFTNVCDQEIASRALLENCTNILRGPDDQDVDFRCLSCSDTETSEDYWSVSGDENPELEKWDENDFTEAMEYLVLSKNSHSLTPTSMDVEGDRELISDDKVKHLNEAVCSSLNQESRNIVLEKQLCTRETSLLKVTSAENEEPEVVSCGLEDDKDLQTTTNNDIHVLSQTFCNNNVPIDFAQRNIRPSYKCKPIRENSESNSALLCKNDKEQYGSGDIKEERFREQANSAEYFDENVDKSEALINEVSTGAIDPKLRGNYFREWGDVLTVGSEDNMSHLSRKNIMTHSKSGDGGICYTSESFPDSGLCSSLLSIDSNRNEISNFASINEHHNVELITNLEENYLDQIHSNKLPTSRHYTELTDSEKEINSKDTESSGVSTLQGTERTINSEEGRGSNFGLDEDSERLSQYSEKENDDFCSLSSGDDVADYETHVDANMNDLCIKNEVSGEDTRKLTRHRRVITRRERSVKYETITTKIPKEVHGEKNALPVTTSSLSLITQNADCTSRVVQTTIQRSVTSSQSITSSITSQYSNTHSGENINAGKCISSSVLTTNLKDCSKNLSTGFTILSQGKVDQNCGSLKIHFDPLDSKTFTEIDENEEEKCSLFNQIRNEEVGKSVICETSHVENTELKKEMIRNNVKTLDSDIKHSNENKDLMAYSESLLPGRTEECVGTSVGENEIKSFDLSQKDIKVKCVQEDDSADNLQVQISSNADPNCHTEISEKIQTLNNTSDKECISVGFHIDYTDDERPLLTVSKSHSDSCKASQMVDMNTTLQKSDTKDVYLPEITEKTDKLRQVQCDSTEHYQTDQKAIDISQLPKKSKCDEDFVDKETSEHKERREDSLNSEKPQADHGAKLQVSEWQPIEGQSQDAVVGYENHKSLEEIEMSDSAHHKSKDDSTDEIKKPTIKISDSREESAGADAESCKQTSNKHNGTLSRVPSKKDRSRQGIRRFTATVCLIEKNKDNPSVQMTATQKPRARSKSPIELRNEQSATVESKQLVSVGHGRVSEICQSFLKKANRGTKSEKNTEQYSPAPSAIQSPALEKKLKWVNEGGKWKRIPVDMIETNAKVKNTITNISGEEDSNSDNANSEICTKVIESVSTEIAKYETFASPDKPKGDVLNKSEDRLCSRADDIGSCHVKPKQPPKTLPKPSEEARRRMLGKNAVAKWTSFSQKRLSWKIENEKSTIGSDGKVHDEIYETLPERHVKSPPEVLRSILHVVSTDNEKSKKQGEEGITSPTNHKSCTSMSTEGNMITGISTHLSNGQNKNVESVKVPDLHPPRISAEKSEAGVDSQSVGHTELQNLQSLSERNHRKQTEMINNGTSIILSKVSSIDEVKKLAEDPAKQQVTSDGQSISVAPDSTVDIPYVDDTCSDSNHDESIGDSDDEVTPTNTPKLRKSKEISGDEDSEDTPRNTPRIKAVKIKQEMFPREDRQKSQCLDNKFDGASEVQCAITEPEVESGSKSECVDESDVKFYIDDDDMENIKILRKSCTRRASDQRRRGIYGVATLQDNSDNRDDIHDGVNLHLDDAGGITPDGQRSRSSREQLLSEIVELEDNVRDASPRTTLSNKRGLSVDPCSTPSDENKKNFNRSQSLPTTSLNGFGQPRIVYKDGHFVIETGLEEHFESEEHGYENCVADKENMCETSQHSVKASSKEETSRSTRKARALTKRRSNSEADLLDKGPLDDDSDLDVFLNNDGEVTVIDSGDGDKSPYWHVLVKRRTKPLNDHSDAESSSSRPLSVDESQLQMSVDDLSSRPEVTKSRKSDNIKRRSASFKELRSFKLKRNSSFREAQERGALLRHAGKNDSVGNLSLSPSEMSISSETRSKGSGILNRMFRRNKSFNEKGSNAANESLFEIKRDSSREPPKNRKMSLKSLFGGKKTKSESSQSVSSDEPPTPPIAVFQSDLDIHAVDSAPSSPYASQKYHRRHTAADLYEQRSHTLPRRPSDTSKPQTLTNSKDHLSVKSLDIQNLANHPKRPISPKPTGLHIPRRNSNASLPISSHRNVMNDVGGVGRSSLGNRLDYCDSVSVSSGNSAHTDVTPTSPPLASDDEGQRPGVTLSSHDVERYVQGGEMTSSNSNDSGIQRDVSLHSSNESLKTIQDSSTNAVVRRRKSPSPRQERPKSEISVRWADLVETNEITPVKRRERLSSSRQRPKSDLEDNLSLFDEMYQDVIEDFDFLSGGSSLSDDMKPFGSQLSLLPYSSLQSLDQLRRQDSFDQKPNKRRMSTPHPIKTRLERSPKKQRRKNPLVRSHSMPENLDKLYKKRRFFSTASSNLHKEDFLRGFDEDSCSDDGSDYSADQISLHEKSLSSRSSSTYLSTLEERPEAESLTYAEALWDHITMDPEELGFRAGDVIEVADMTDKDWWWGAIEDREGWFPATFVRLRVNQERPEELSGRLEEVAEHSSPLLHRMSVINKEQARENVVNEILTAERDYVKHLKDVVEGYIKNARKRTDMFNEERISVLFGNMESIYDFSDRFLQRVEKSYQEEHPHLSELGQCFLNCSKEFEIYSDYCNNHPSASEELKELYRKQKYRHFFEACRLLQEMIEIPLEGFLLTPVQKICKYPLQLAELLKYTPPSHPDHQNVAAALEAMKKIAALINERKRKMESIEKLARWQSAVEDWQGTNLIEESSELIHSGEMYKINSAGWSQERCFFLFDHQLIYCKKDLLKRNGYSYRGRVDLDDCEVTDVEDGKDSQYNVTVKNAWKLHEVVRDKWYLLYTKTDTEKQKWLKAFNSERQKVKEDQENNFVPCEWKRMVLNKIKSSQERGKRTPVPSSDFVRGIPSHATLPRSYGKKVQKKKAWFIFGNKKTK